jgi:hypothetical protein
VEVRIAEVSRQICLGLGTVEFYSRREDTLLREPFISIEVMKNLGVIMSADLRLNYQTTHVISKVSIKA